MTNPMNPVVKDLWVAALRSGEYQQGTNYLRNSNDHYCCLGVLCEVAIKAGVEVKVNLTIGPATYDGRGQHPPRSVTEWAGLNTDSPNIIPEDDASKALTDINDSGTSFNQIANIIERYL